MATTEAVPLGGAVSHRRIHLLSQGPGLAGVSTTKGDLAHPENAGRTLRRNWILSPPGFSEDEPALGERLGEHVGAIPPPATEGRPASTPCPSKWHQPEMSALPDGIGASSSASSWESAGTTQLDLSVDGPNRNQGPSHRR